MDEDLEQNLVEEYPSLYDYYDTTDDTEAPDKTPPIEAYGFECDDGWYDLIRTVSHVIEQFNRRQDDPVRAVQVKEKFGQLRFYTDRSPDFVYGVTRMAEGLSRKVCELCGAMSDDVRRHRGRRIKTVCETCGLEWRNAPDEVEVWCFDMECYECGSQTPVFYPREIGGTHGGTWDAVGAELADLSDGVVGRVYSDVQETEVWGNQCLSCGAYQGNYYVFRAAEDKTEELGGWIEESGEFEQVAVIDRRETDTGTPAK